MGRTEGSEARQAHQNAEVFPIGVPNDRFAKYFIGQSYLVPVSTEQVKILNVAPLNPAAATTGTSTRRTRASRFSFGLPCGYYREWGKALQELHPGDVLNIAPGVKHWHGGAHDS